ncbi:DUF2721 domain-containing protein [Amphiplicatus metriothermophilus]|uniref:DUF2721 domain-containing protein n=1 Tax=Amphiplicatus metriothermophilus TaxID=1519374 RepID=A0A239PKG8_9PROT|nr:DUF2721 domain-containing protein [Amphiplicatus metriothermophilus]MBB5517591.1 VIT1/CCC1 family predicted Fe2+/Mn2+ transporter [Amphiplicatus metriothermophilus]SNT68075.1 Protein of unknown function [Amphiplicatus metriothermophilus]
MSDASAFDDIGHIIQLSVAPVFLLVAIGSMLNVMTARLGRIIDRARRLEEDLSGDLDESARARSVGELKALDRRMLYANAAINLSAAAALLIAFVVALMFVGGLAGADTLIPIAVLFVLAMIGVIAALCAFLAEISIATRTVRVRAELMRK